MKDSEGKLIVVGEENHEAVVGGVDELDPLGRGGGGVAGCGGGVECGGGVSGLDPGGGGEEGAVRGERGEWGWRGWEGFTKGER